MRRGRGAATLTTSPLPQASTALYREGPWGPVVGKRETKVDIWASQDCGTLPLIQVTTCGAHWENPWSSTTGDQTGTEKRGRACSVHLQKDTSKDLETVLSGQAGHCLGSLVRWDQRLCLTAGQGCWLDILRGQPAVGCTLWLPGFCGPI